MIVGIAGKATAGKDTLAYYINKCSVASHQVEFKRMAFADILKNMCKEHFGLTDDQLWGDKKEHADLRFPKGDHHGFSSNPADYWTPREIMQNLGSFYRSVDHNFWVHALDRTLVAGEHVVVPDVRYLNEVGHIKDSGGFMIKIVRGDADDIHNMHHESETSLDGLGDDTFDVVVHNNGTLEDLQASANNLIPALIKINDLVNKGGVYNGEEEER